jgi:hypothetical protein
MLTQRQIREPIQSALWRTETMHKEDRPGPVKTRKPVIVGARALGEFGDDPHRYGGSKARKNYAATSPITRAWGGKKIVAARYVHNNRLIDTLTAQAFAALNASPGARTFHDDLRNRGIDHQDALRRLANNLTGILHRCLTTRTSMTRPPPGLTGRSRLPL